MDKSKWIGSKIFCDRHKGEKKKRSFTVEQVHLQCLQYLSYTEAEILL